MSMFWIKVIGIPLMVFFSVALFFFIQFSKKVEASRGLPKDFLPFQKLTDDHRNTFLILGDSTGFGLGASSASTTVAGRLGDTLAATYVENRAVVGARVSNLKEQIDLASLSHYNHVLILIGGNDIVRFESAESASDRLDLELGTIADRADQVIVACAGNVGATSLFPFFIRPFHTALNLKYHEAFAKIAAKHKAIYVNFYTPPAQDPFVQEPDVYLAADSFHPSDRGYKLWADTINAKISR